MYKQIKVPFIDLYKQYQKISDDIDQAIRQVLESGWYILGNEVKHFEKELAQYIGTNYAVGLASGTDALTIAPKALGISKGDGIILPANVYPSAFGISLTGAHLQLADVEEDSLNISLRTIEKAFDRTTKAIVVVHLYGNPVDLDPIILFAKKKKIAIIEDCAQSIGSEYKGNKVGSLGDISCFSFYPTKNLGAYGDGGAILTNNKKLAIQSFLWRTYGEDSRYHSVLQGQNSRLDEIQAAILLSKFKYLDKWNQQRRRLALIYIKNLSSLPVQFINECPGGESNYHLFVIKTRKRDQLAKFLKDKGIETGIHYPVTIHLTPSYSYLSLKKGSFPVSEKSCQSILSLPIYPEMSDKDIEYVIDQTKKFFKSNS